MVNVNFKIVMNVLLYVYLQTFQFPEYATVIARMHDECISAQNWERLSSISHITYSLELRDMETPLYTIISYKTNGKRIVKVVFMLF